MQAHLRNKIFYKMIYKVPMPKECLKIDFKGGQFWLPGPDEPASWTNRSMPRNSDSDK
jgi:hypothetical protein